MELQELRVHRELPAQQVKTELVVQMVQQVPQAQQD